MEKTFSINQIKAAAKNANISQMTSNKIINNLKNIPKTPVLDEAIKNFQFEYNLHNITK